MPHSLDAESKRLDDLLESLVSATAPELVASYGVGTDTAGALLVSAGDRGSSLSCPPSRQVRPPLRRLFR